MSLKPQSTARLEAFSDGVFAVIITIMVLELKVPHEDGPEGIYALIPNVLVYLLSFAFTGIYWINHNHLLGRIETEEPIVNYANLGFLFCLSLLPFFTSYVIEKKLDAFAVCLYAVSMVVTGFSFLLLRLALHRNIKRSGRLEPEDLIARNGHLISLGLYALAAPLAWFHPQTALVVIALVTAVWIVPDLRF